MVAAVIFVVVVALLAMFQLGLVCGAPWGRFAWGGQHRVLPPHLRIASTASLVLYVAFAVVVLDRAHGIEFLAESIANVGTWVVFVCMTLSVIANAISRSKPERYTGTPIALTLAVTSAIVAVG